MRDFQAPAIPTVNKYGSDRYIIGTMPEFARRVESDGIQFQSHSPSWYDNMNAVECVEALKHGHQPSVAASEKFLAEIEHLIPAPTARHDWTDDVTGAVPNVPAFLAGTPLNMRRRIRRENESAPIAIVVDLVTSGGIKGAVMSRRGAAIVALARALASRRPVELWAGAGLGTKGGKALWQFYQIETAPLDLTRAAFMMGHAAPTRGMMYNLGRKLGWFDGNWPYGDTRATPEAYRAVVARALPHVGECIIVPGAHISDQNVADPVGWCRDMIAAHTGDDALAA